GGHGQSETFDAFGDSEEFVNQGISGVFSLTTVLGRKVNEIRALIQGETRKRHAIFKGAPEIQIVGVGEFGQRFYLPGNNDNGKLQVQDNFSYTFAKHDVKFGGDVNSFVDRKDTFAGWSAGRYNFSSLCDFDPNPNTCAGLATPPTASNPNFYFQGFGLNGLDPFTANTLFPNYQTGLGLAWSVGSDSHPTVLRAAWGLYYAQTPTIFFPQVSNGGGSKSSTLFCVPLFGCSPASGVPYNFPSSLPFGSNDLCVQAAATIGCPGIEYADPAFRNPRVSSLTVGAVRQLSNEWSGWGRYRCGRWGG